MSWPQQDLQQAWQIVVNIWQHGPSGIPERGSVGLRMLLMGSAATLLLAQVSTPPSMRAAADIVTWMEETAVVLQICVLLLSHKGRKWTFDALDTVLAVVLGVTLLGIVVGLPLGEQTWSVLTLSAACQHRRADAILSLQGPCRRPLPSG